MEYVKLLHFIVHCICIPLQFLFSDIIRANLDIFIVLVGKNNVLRGKQIPSPTLIKQNTKINLQLPLMHCGVRVMYWLWLNKKLQFRQL